MVPRRYDDVAPRGDAREYVVISENVAPLKDALAVKYQVYDLAPYAVGQPVLTIPYADLEGIFRPRYLP